MSGVGERFRMAGFRLPKPLIGILGRPMVAHVLEMFPSISDPLIIANEDHLQSEEFQLGSIITEVRPKARIVSIAPHKKGPGWALLQAQEFIDRMRPTIVSYCDYTAMFDETKFIEALDQSDGLIGTYSGFHPHMFRSTSFAYVKLTDYGSVSNIQEKQPYTEEPLSEQASCGLYGFASGDLLLEALHDQVANNDSLNGEYYTSLTYKSLLRSGKTIKTFKVDSFMQWGTPEDLSDFLYWSDAFEEVTRSQGLSSPPSDGTSLLLAAGAGQRFKNSGYQDEKPLLPVNGRTGWSSVVRSLPNLTDKRLVCRSDQIGFDELRSQAEDESSAVTVLDGMTRGQAESALFGLRDCIRARSPVVVAACDGLFVGSTSVSGMDVAPTMWLARAYRPAEIHPEQFSWASVDSTGAVTAVLLKQAPPGPGWLTLTGTFSFPSVEIAIEIVEDYLCNGNQLNGEFYLDRCFYDLVDREIDVRAVVAPAFMGFGTPLEYESYRYWQRTFNSWVAHPYKITEDPLVAPDDHGRLLRQLSIPSVPFWEFHTN
jgi:dTDP-glucose pyrophosphorylase